MASILQNPCACGRTGAGFSTKGGRVVSNSYGVDVLPEKTETGQNAVVYLRFINKLTFIILGRTAISGKISSRGQKTRNGRNEVWQKRGGSRSFSEGRNMALGNHFDG